MAATVEIDWLYHAAGFGPVVVSWQSGAQPTKSKEFPTRAEGMAFADKKMGARGMLVINLDLTPGQRAKQEERKARLAALFN